MSEDSTLDPAVLERLRRSVAFRIAYDGRIEIDGEPVTHERVERVIRRGLDLDHNGETILRLGDQWCYIHVADAPFLVERARLHEHDGAAWVELRLNDGRVLEVLAASLRQTSTGGLECSVPSRWSAPAMTARFTNTAQMDLAPYLYAPEDLQATPDTASSASETSGFMLLLGSHRVTIPSPREPSVVRTPADSPARMR